MSLSLTSRRFLSALFATLLLYGFASAMYYVNRTADSAINENVALDADFVEGDVGGSDEAVEFLLCLRSSLRGVFPYTALFFELFVGFCVLVGSSV